MSKKKLRIVHYPQIGHKPFEVEVDNLQEAKLLYNTLADYDLFQYNNQIKPDYANATVVQEWSEEECEWIDWSDDKTGIDNINEYFEQLPIIAPGTRIIITGNINNHSFEVGQECVVVEWDDFSGEDDGNYGVEASAINGGEHWFVRHTDYIVKKHKRGDEL